MCGFLHNITHLFMQNTILIFKRKGLLLLAVLILSPIVGFSQANMLFCINNDENNGAPEWPFTTISFAKDKTVRCMVYLTAPLVNGDFVTFRVSYRSNGTDTVAESTNYRLSLQPEWDWFYYKFNFKAIGDYKVELLDSKDKLLTEKTLHLVE
jgi:hypothetical protein